MEEELYHCEGCDMDKQEQGGPPFICEDCMEDFRNMGLRYRELSEENFKLKKRIRKMELAILNHCEVLQAAMRNC